MRRMLHVAVLCSTVFLLVCSGVARPDSSPEIINPKLILDQFDVAKDGDILLLPVQLERKTYLFMLDTGASVTFVDISLRRWLGALLGTAECKTPNGTIKAQVFKLPLATFGKIPLRTGAVFAYDLKELREISGLEIYGILGMDCLTKHIVRLDFDQGKVIFFTALPPKVGYPMKISYQEAQRRYFIDELRDGDGPLDFLVDTECPYKCPCVVGRISGLEKPLAFLVDTGHQCSSGDLQKDIFEAVTKARKCKTMGKGMSLTLSGKSRVTYGKLDAVSVGKFSHRQLIFNSPGTDNSLGLDYLSRYIVTFDFSKDKMYLKEGMGFDRPATDHLDRSGLHLLRIKGKTVVESVEKGRPAALSGIRPQDEILRVGNLKAGESSLWTLRRFLCSGGKKMRMVVKRGAKEINLSMSLEK